jgi:DNA modification methylase
VSVIHGDCLEVMPTLDAESIDAVITDPPYGLSFMGKHWDHGIPGVDFWTEALRVAKPGAHLLAFGGTRTFHRLTVAIEDAGFEIQDCLSWLYGSGFPKHKSKLKPAWEPIILARKPADKATPLNIDACRIEHNGRRSPCKADGTVSRNSAGVLGGGHQDSASFDVSVGRWPANVVLDEVAASMLDEQSGELTSGTLPAGTQREGIGYHGGLGVTVRNSFIGNSGGASRFFYTAKAARSERNDGLEGMPERLSVDDDWVSESRKDAPSGGRTSLQANHHPTVKPIALMRWLVRLITPPNGVVLDPFCGSGTTGIAAVLEKRQFIGIEENAEYAEIAEKRIAHWGAQGILDLGGAA